MTSATSPFDRLTESDTLQESEYKELTALSIQAFRIAREHAYSAPIPVLMIAFKEYENLPERQRYHYLKLFVETYAKKPVVMSPEPQQQEHTTTDETSTPSSSVDSVALHVRIKKTLKDKVTQAVKKSGQSQQEFLITALEKAVGETLNPTNETIALSQEALTKAHEAEQAIRRLTSTLSRTSR